MRLRENAAASLRGGPEPPTHPLDTATSPAWAGPVPFRPSPRMSQDPASRPGPAPDWLDATEPVLSALLQAGNLERLAREAERCLERNPGDSTAHFYLVLALTDLKRPAEALRHLDQLLAAEPDQVRTHVAALCLYGAGERWAKVRHHVAEGLRLDPEAAFFHRFAAIAALTKLDMAAARRHISRARELDPDDADIANLHIRIHGATETSALAALKRLEEYRAALRLDPHNAALHNSMGDVLLDELDDPAAAEIAYREALRLDPGNRVYQTDLFHAVAARSLIYRLFSLPTRAFRWLGLAGRTILRQPWRLLFVIIGFKAVMGYFAWLALATVVFWPGGKGYEWLLVSEIRRGAAASDAELRTWFWLRRWPRWVRFAAFLGINLTLWGTLFTLTGLPLGPGYAAVGVFAAVHLLFVSLSWAWRQQRTAAARRRLRQGGPAAVPEGAS